jgi:hypothetical protein
MSRNCSHSSELAQALDTAALTRQFVSCGVRNLTPGVDKRTAFIETIFDSDVERWNETPAFSGEGSPARRVLARLELRPAAAWDDEEQPRARLSQPRNAEVRPPGARALSVLSILSTGGGIAAAARWQWSTLVPDRPRSRNRRPLRRGDRAAGAERGLAVRGV